MSNKMNARANIRWKLLASASVAALVTSGAGQAQADTDRSLLWIELGSQLERVTGGDSGFVPPFYSHFDAPVDSPTAIQKELPWSLGADGKISFQPEESEWIFSAGVRYGRAKSHRNTQQKTDPGQFQSVYPSLLFHYYSPGGQYYYYKWKCCETRTVTPSKAVFADVQSNHQESHTVLDFQAGKDVGLGLLGKQSTSVMAAGVRFAQFKSRTDIRVKARTDLEHYNGWSFYPTILSAHPEKYSLSSRFNVHSLTAGSERNTKLVGPSISWDASAALAGHPDTAQFTFDWGINAAVLFGKQKARTHHQSSARYDRSKYGYSSLYNHPRVDSDRSRSVVVPNIGGMAGFSIRFPNARVSIGYRADVFIGAMDGGWDVRKSQSRSFMGPFASISVGMGD